MDRSNPVLSETTQDFSLENGPKVNHEVGILFSNPCPLCHDLEVAIETVSIVKRVEENHPGPILNPS